MFRERANCAWNRSREGHGVLRRRRRSLRRPARRSPRAAATLRDARLRVLVVSDRRRFAERIVPALAADPRLRVLGVARDAARLARTTAPDVLVVDAASPRAAEALRVANAQSRVATVVIGRPEAAENVRGCAFVAATCPENVLADCFFAVASLAAAFASAPSLRRN